MSAAIPIPLLQNLPDVAVTPAVGVDEYALVWDNDTRLFVLRAPFSGTPYALLAGRAGGQTLYGGTAANDDITIHGTSDATRTTSYVLLQPSGGDVGIGTSAPQRTLDVNGTGLFSDWLHFVNGKGIVADGDIYIKESGGNSILAIGSHVYWGSSSGGDVYYSIGDAFNGIKVLTLVNSNAVSNTLYLKAGNVGINDTAPAEKLDVTGNANVTGVYKVDDVQVLSNRVIDARAADVANSGDATTDGLIDALRDALVAHGLIAAA